MDSVNPEMRKRHVPLTKGSPLTSASLEMRIEPGLVVLFPSYLEHKVVPYDPVATEEADVPQRISVAFNIMPHLDLVGSETDRVSAHNDRFLATNWAHLDFRSWAVGSPERSKDL